ncbi:MAG: hypothetical protein RLZZ244_2639 [Verrucomicrobiota bacterium]|jgi:LPS export ABC transporter permease LptF
MKVLDRYIGGQMVLVTSIAVAVLSVVLVFGNAMKKLLDLLIDQSAPWEVLVALMGLIIPQVLTFTVPWAFLAAVLLVFGRMSAEHEITALRASGVSMMRMCAAIFALAAVCVSLCLWINVSVAPRAETRFREVLHDLSDKGVMALFGSDRIIDTFPGRKICVGQSEGNEVRNLLVYEMGPNNEPMKVIFAKRGVLEKDDRLKRLILRLFEVRWEQRDEKFPGDLRRIHQGITIDSIPLIISYKELQERSKKERKLSSMTVEELIKRSGAEDAPEADRLKKQSEVRTEVSRRFAMALSALVLALVGIPLAVTAQRKETAAGFLMSMVLGFLYFILMNAARSAKPQWHPEWLMWIPNALFLGFGALFFLRLARR